MDWKQYENEIYDYFRSVYPEATLTPDARITGKFSKIERQIDLLIEVEMADFRFRVVVDGKYRDKKIDVNDVEAFLSFVRDVEASKGLMISTEGYSSAAMNRAALVAADFVVIPIGPDLFSLQGRRITFR